MSRKEHWQDFFCEDYIAFSEEILHPERTEFEVNQLIRLLELPRGAKILDLGCGQGRIAVPLAQKGYAVTGFDGSADLLEEAKRRAVQAEVAVDFVHGDMRELDYLEEFDAVINLGTAFGYVADEADDQNVLARIHRALKPGGQLVQDLENRELKVKNSELQSWNLMQGMPVWSKRSFQPVTGRWREEISWLDGQEIKSKVLDLRLYSATEIRKMITDAGFDMKGIYGGLDYSFLTVSSPRMVTWSLKV